MKNDRRVQGIRGAVRVDTGARLGRVNSEARSTDEGEIRVRDSGESKASVLRCGAGTTKTMTKKVCNPHAWWLLCCTCGGGLGCEERRVVTVKEEESMDSMKDFREGGDRHSS